MIQPIQYGGSESLRQLIIEHVTYFPETIFTIFLNKKVNRPMICFLYRFGIYTLHVNQQNNPSK